MRFPRVGVANLATLFLCVLAGAASSADPAATTFRAGTLVIRDAWTRPTMAGMPMGVGYFTLVNEGPVADAVIAASSPVAGSVEMHQTTMSDGMARMRPLKEIVIPAKSTVSVAPNGIHLMLVDLKAPLNAGTTVPLVLQLRNAGRVEIRLSVEARAE